MAAIEAAKMPMAASSGTPQPRLRVRLAETPQDIQDSGIFDEAQCQDHHREERGHSKDPEL